jgi:hypothetical protein
MPEQMTITVYKFDELEGRAKEKARQWLADTATDHEWWDGVYDLAKEDGAKRGFEIEDIRFSGFWSQGDGASWTGSVDVKQFVEWMLEQPEDTPAHRWVDADRHRYLCLVELMKDGWIERNINVTRSGYHYVHENTTGPENDLNWDPLFTEMELARHEESTLHSEGVLKGASVVGVAEGIDVKHLIEDLDAKIKEEVRAFSRHIYKQLEAEYDHLTSDEQLTEMAEANDYRFDEDGDVV